MKIAIIPKIVFVVALAALVGGCNSQEKMDRESIVKVLKARKEALDTGFVKTLAGPQQDRKRTLRALKQVEYIDCPDEFKTAWLAYIQAWERFATPSPPQMQVKNILSKNTSIDVGGSLGTANAAHYATTHNNNGRLADKWESEDTGEFLRAVERAALKFNVDALKYE